MDIDNPREEIVFPGQRGKFLKVLQKKFHKEEHNTQKGNTTETNGATKHLTLFLKIYISLLFMYLTIVFKELTKTQGHANSYVNV
jgi:hypothetical protein